MTIPKRLPTVLTLPTLTVMFFDFVFTLVGQPASYWANHKLYNEGSPLGIALMPQSPYLFMAFLAIYLAAANLLMRYLPLFPGLVLSVALYLGHFWGSSSWINVIFHASSVQNSWYQHIAYAVAVALMTTGWIWWYLRMTKEKAR